MKVKELIEKLQELDPDGEKEVIIEGEYESFTPINVDCYDKNEVKIYG